MEFDGVIPTDLPPEQIAAYLAAIAEYLQSKSEGLSVVLLIMYSVLCMLCVILIVYLRHNHNGALRGDSDAARKTLLPAFEPLFWILGFATGAYCIIDFAYLELKQLIGVGSSAVVYNGLLNSKTLVAIKVYTPTTVTEDTVAEFSHETALCGALNHPNIVRFYGMCVSPPTICLVSELCQGNLDQVTWAIAKRSQQHQQPDTHHHQRRQQFLVNLGYMIDAARAVAYIHSFSPAFVHRDIKPANFLVNAQGNMKLTDFGELRFLPKMTNGSSSVTATMGSENNNYNENDSKPENISVADSTSGTSTGANSSRRNQTTASSSPEPKSLVYMNYEAAKRNEAKALAIVSQVYGARLPQMQTTKKSTLQMTVKGTVDYMAPEMINGKGGFANYGEAADVYSLAITMWDILNPDREKYPSTNNHHLRIFESVIAGHRPELDPLLHPSLRELLASSWHQDHWRRPSAQAIVAVLERIQEEVASTLTAELQDELENNLALFKIGDDSSVLSVNGEVIVGKMRDDLHSVATASEGIRLGNMLMDAGFLHHVKHARSFECASDALYFFDDDHIRFCQPFAMLDSEEQHTQHHQYQPNQYHHRKSQQNVGRSHAHLQPQAQTQAQLPGSSVWLGRPLFPGKQPVHMNSVSASEFSDTVTAESTTGGGALARDGFSDSSNTATSSGAGSCTCRRLGQRLQQQKSVKRLFRLRKHATILEDNALTATLLAQESGAFQISNQSNSRSLDAFDETHAGCIV